MRRECSRISSSNVALRKSPLIRSQSVLPAFQADSRGHFSHGINRLHIYIRDLETNTCNTHGKPKILKQKGSTALVDGDNALGSVVGEFCTDLAIKLCREHGIGWVTANNSNHFGG